jgi:hypothetical protein
MADIKVKNAFNQADTANVVKPEDVVAAILANEDFIEDLAADATFLAALKDYFDGIYEPIVI